MPVKEEPKEQSGKYHAPALEKGLDILEYLAFEGKPLSQTDIAAGINKSPNEIYRMLVCLEQRGYLLRDEISGKYRQTLKLFHLSHRHSPIDEMRRAARYPMDDLAERIKQSCHLCVIYQDKLIVIAQSRSPEPIALSIEEGSLFPVMLTASGRVLLSFMEEYERLEFLKRNDLFVSYPVSRQQKFLTGLRDIKTKGYYITDSDLATGVVDISVPIRNGLDAIASLTVSILSIQLEKTLSYDDIVSIVKQAADKISSNLGFANL